MCVCVWLDKACHYVCVTEEASDQEDACRDRTLFDLIVRKAKVRLDLDKRTERQIDNVVSYLLLYCSSN